MTRTFKLNDLQRILLSNACQCDDGSLLPAPESIVSQNERIRKAVAALIKRSLAAETEIIDRARQWREQDGQPIGVVITDAGRAIIGTEEEPDTPGKLVANLTDAITPHDAPTASSQPTSKIAKVIDLLRRDGGATLTELVEATTWLPHTTRAALTGLRKKCHAIIRYKRDGATRYRIAPVA